MKIGGASQITSNSTVASSSAVPYRTGDVVVVQVVKIQSVSDGASELILKFPDGEFLNTVLPEKFGGREGEFLSLKIQSKTEKQVFAEIIRNQENHPSFHNNIVELLTRLSAPVNNDNCAIIQQMLKNELAVTPENFKLLSESIENYKDLSIEQIIFMIKYKIPITAQSVSMINYLNENQALIGEQFLLLFYEFINQKKPNDVIANSLKAFFNSPAKGSLTPSSLKMPNTINNLKDILHDLIGKKTLGENTAAKVGEFLQKTKTHFEYMKLFNSDIFYIQIPLNINGYFGTAEFYVQKEIKSEENNSSERSFFIKIPTSNMGMIEVFITMHNNNRVQLHFRTDEQDCIATIKRNIIKLSDSLSDINFTVSKISYNQIPSGINLQNFERNASLINRKKNMDWKV